MGQTAAKQSGRALSPTLRRRSGCSDRGRWLETGDHPSNRNGGHAAFSDQRRDGCGKPAVRGLRLELLISGKARSDGVRQMAWATNTLSAAGFDVKGNIASGDAETVEARAVQDLGIDLLIMGAYTHSPWRKLLRGSKTANLLRSATIPTLLLR